jgi:XTP/dITP diphosphohydrolase
MITLIVATRNEHKLAEIRTILGERCHCLILEDDNAPMVKEDAGSFAGNATKKSVELARHLASCPTTRHLFERISPATFTLADDSGLEVDALNGAPGVHSARFAALDTAGTANSPDAENIAKLLRLLKDVPTEKRTARFRCVLALTPIFSQDPQNASPACAANEFELQTELFEGVCEGRIGFTLHGSGGFGYDPLFIPDGYEQSFAELGEATKNQFSHRARALEELKRYLDTL